MSDRRGATKSKIREELRYATGGAYGGGCGTGSWGRV